MSKTITRADLVNAIYEEVGLARNECATFLDDTLNKIAECLAEGEPVKISSFASFSIRQKNARTGRIPKTGEAARIPARKVIVFQASQTLKEKLSNST